jgi:hypothetical protein
LGKILHVTSVDRSAEYLNTGLAEAGYGPVTA